MKYLYKGMALPGWGDVSGSVLLGWHEKVGPSTAASLLSIPDGCPDAADGGCGYWLHRACYDGQETCMNALQNGMYTILRARHADTIFSREP